MPARNRMKLTLALERYDRHFPFFDGTVTPPGNVDFNILQVGQSVTLRDGTDRHRRSFQTTLSLLAKGDLKFEYGVPWEEIKWYVTSKEKVGFRKKTGVFIEPIGKREDLGDLLEKGRIDAFFLPHPPHSVMAGEKKARRLFPDTKNEELRYFKKYGYFPIMHVLAIREDLAAKEPWLPSAMVECYARAKEIAAGYYEDPNWSRLAWGRHYFEEERSLLGADPWPHGLKANYANLERFIEYSCDQNLLESRIPVESLFPEQVLDT